MIIKRSESASSLVSERAQIALRRLVFDEQSAKHQAETLAPQGV